MQATYLNAPSRTKAVVAGGGLMGTDIAVVLLRAQCTTTVIKSNPATHDALRERIRGNLEAIGRADNLKYLHFAENVDGIDWSDINLVIECIPEVLESKQKLFRTLDQLTPPTTILASNSSSFPISDIARGCQHMKRMLGLHFFLPAHLVPLVEVVHGAESDPAAADELATFMRRCGSVPIHAHKDIPGFVGNRLQHALLREAFSLVQDGVASPEDVDAAVKFGFGFRFLAAGPILQKDHSGYDTHAAAAATIYPSLSNVSVPPPVLAEKPLKGELGMKSGQGFYTWTEESAAAEKARYAKALRSALQLLESDLPAIDP